MRKILISGAILMLACVRSHSQGVYEYYYNDSPPDEQSHDPEPQSDLFMIPAWGSVNLFRSYSEFGFASARYNRRGYSGYLTRDFRGTADISGLVTRISGFSLPYALRRADYGQSDDPVHDTHINIWQNAAIDDYSTQIAPVIRTGMGVTAFAGTRGGNTGIRFYAGGELPALGEQGYAGISVGFRAGRDPNIGGVFTQEPQVFFGADMTIASGHTLSLSVGASASERGLRSYASVEAFELTGDNYYNPSWGYYDGRERSAKTLNKLDIFPFVNYTGRLSASTTLTIAAFLRSGHEKRSGISWFDAQTPYPDYYRYMPGYESSNAGWPGGDPRVTQIFWDQLAEQNINRGDQAAYIIDDRVERMNNYQIAASAQTVVDMSFTLTYGIRHNVDNRNKYKELRDLLGGQPIRDVDQYLLDDDVFGEYHLNDSRNPDRLVGEGDRFGYDYRLSAERTDIFAALKYAAGSFHTTIGIEAGQGSLHREGFYEKELFPGRASYGRSDKIVFNPYAAKWSISWSLPSRRHVNFSVMAAETMPYAGAVFLNPDYSNYAIGKPQTIRIFTADAHYARTFRRVIVNVSAFATRTSRESAVYRYWDDIESVYADMSLTGIDKLYYGLEFAAQWDISTKFTFNFASSIGRHTYDSNPDVTIINDVTRHTIVTGSSSYLKGYNLTTSPRHAVMGELRYHSWGWVASVSGSYMGGRYVDISPLRRMERAYGLAGSTEKYHDFISQEKLGDAFVMNVFLLRSFRIGGGSLTAVASVNNALGNRDIVYGGYEQMRIAKSGSAPNLNWKPFDTKYLYSYGRTYYVSLSYSF